MSPEAVDGRRILQTLIAITLLTSLGVIGFYVASKGTGKLPVQITRFVLNVLLCLWLYRGSRTAKWIMIVLLGLGGLGSLVAGFTVTPELLLLAGLYLAFALVLVASSNVEAFLAYQRGDA